MTNKQLRYEEVIHIAKNGTMNMVELIESLENIEKDKKNVPLVFAEIFKDEINANDEQKLFNGIKKLIKKYADDKNFATAINEFTKVISGGASLAQILQITVDEVLNPSAESELMVEGVELPEGDLQ